ncbi:uncharacterized protein LOC135498825 [Lineus longissimus]|uniref:uncharacterized protein LOC135498825 n=1 Tax=Lineus longissimus TaxID=88925 RepID=UPI002B4D1FD1
MRRFRETDTVLSLFYFVEGTSKVQGCELMLAGEKLKRDQLSLKEVGRTSNTTLHIKDDDDLQLSSDVEPLDEEEMDKNEEENNLLLLVQFAQKPVLEIYKVQLWR